MYDLINDKKACSLTVEERLVAMCCIYNRKINFTPQKDYTFIKRLWLCHITSSIISIGTQPPLMHIQ